MSYHNQSALIIGAGISGFAAAKYLAAAGMAISQGWTRLVGPAMLVGTFGYAIGTYIGIIVGSMLGA